MARTITFEYDDNKYVLEFNRATTQKGLRSGITAETLQSNPLDILPRLFKLSFKKNHPRVTDNVIDKIYDSLKQRDELTKALLEMYYDPIAEIFEDSDEAKVEWVLE